MDQQSQQIEWRGLLDHIAGTFRYLAAQLGQLTAPQLWIQLLVLVSLFLVAHVAARYLAPRLTERMRGLQTSKAVLRLLVLLVRRTRSILFLALLWPAVWIMRSVTWPSYSYLLAIISTLLLLWLILSITSRLIRNTALVRALAVVVWTTAALYLVGLLPRTVDLLDAAAITIGDLRISVLLILKAGFTLAVLLWLATLVGGVVERRLQTVDDMSPTMRVLISKFTRIVLIVLAFLMGMQTIGFNLTGLTVFSGAVGVGIGFGLQKVVSNLISGFILLLDKSIKPGDVIELGETFGWITSLSARYVSVITRDGREYLIPNEDLITNQVINWSYSDSRVRLELKFGVSYGANPHEVRKLAVEAASRPRRVIADPPPVCHLAGFGESSLDFLLRFWIDDPAGGVANIRSEVLLALWDLLAENGVEIPYPHREILVRSPIEIATKTDN